MPHKNGRRVELPRRTVRMILEGDYEGVELVCRLDFSLERYFDFRRMFELGAKGDEATIDVCRRFGDDILTEWNLAVEGKDLPANAEGFLQLPLDLTLLIMGKWIGAMELPAAPLARPSPHGRAPRQRSRSSS